MLSPSSFVVSVVFYSSSSVSLARLSVGRGAAPPPPPPSLGPLLSGLHPIEDLGPPKYAPDSGIATPNQAQTPSLPPPS